MINANKDTTMMKSIANGLKRGGPNPKMNCTSAIDIKMNTITLNLLSDFGKENCFMSISTFSSVFVSLNATLLKRISQK